MYEDHEVVNVSNWSWFGEYVGRKVTLGDGRKVTELQHRRVMEEHLGRKLRSDEHVHHKDGVKYNNSLDNLEVLTASEHAKHHAPRVPPLELVCKFCGRAFTRPGSQERHGRKMGKAGPFCGKSCANRGTLDPRSNFHGVRKLTLEQAKEIKKHLAGGEILRTIAERYGVKRSTIECIRAGRSWKDA